MAEFHFVEDYESQVARLVRDYPLDEAMSLAVGGNYEEVGNTIFGLLKRAGLSNGMSVLDLGCGSGRVAIRIAEELDVEYLGLDVVRALLEYSASRCPPHFRFLLNRQLEIPAATDTIDFAFATSVFTHLLHEETYIYLRDIRRVLKSEGTLIFSFLEFSMPHHWPVFEQTVKSQVDSTKPHLNMFVERSQIEVWCDHLGYQVQEYIDGRTATPGNAPLGQSMVVLRPASPRLG